MLLLYKHIFVWNLEFHGFYNIKKFSFYKYDEVLSLLNSSLIFLPTPYSISFLWNIGFILGFTLFLQIITGLILSMNYVALSSLAFDSVIHIMRDIDSGWIIRYIHINGASLFFFFLYFHIFRGVYFGSPSKRPMVWLSGLIIFLLTIAVAFIGYVLPWGQISFWGATVITRILSAIPYIGKDLVLWIWGNFSVSQPTLNRFYSIHFLGPFIILALVVVHLIFLHKTGSSNPLGVSSSFDTIKFFSYFFLKDIFPIVLIIGVILCFVCLSPNLIGDVENFNFASISTTPPHIQPEWYFLFAYAILRSIPSKLGGVVAILGSILVFITLSFKKFFISKKFLPIRKNFYWVFVVSILLLTWIGSKPVEDPFITIGQFVTVLYFFIFLLI